MPDSQPSYTEFEAGFGYRFRRRELLSLALTHRSFPLEPGEDTNEKLEFLGDAVLDLAISDLLLARFPEAREGELSKMRAALVNARVLAKKPRLWPWAAGYAWAGAKSAAAADKKALFWPVRMRPC